MRAWTGLLAIFVCLGALAGPGEGAELRAVQTGTTTLNAGSNTVTATISSVDTTKAFLVFGLEGSDNSPDDLQISGQITNATTLTFSRTGTTNAVVLKWYVAEFTTGVAVQRGAATIPDVGNPADIDVPLPSAIDLSKSFPLISFRTSGSDFDGSDFIRAKLIEDGTNGTCNPAASHCLRLYAPDGSPTAIVEWQVVEYQDASVQTGDTSFAFGDTVQNAAVTAVDTAKSWLVYSYECAPAFCNSDLANISSKMVSGEITSTTNLRFEREFGGVSPEQINVTWYLVEFTDGTTVQHGLELQGAGVGSTNRALTPVNPAASIAAAGIYGRGGRTTFQADDDPGVGWFDLDVTSSTNLNLRRGRTTTEARAPWYVVSFEPAQTFTAHRLVYGTSDGPADTPRARMWQATNNVWSGELLTTRADTDIHYVVSAQSPVADEEIVAVLSDAPAIDVMRWSASGWTQEWRTTGLAVASTVRRGVAVAYEQTSGDAMVVTTDDTGNPRFRTWNGSTWSADAPVFGTPPAAGQAVQWIELASDPTSDRIALVYSDAASDVHAIVWDGTSWLEGATEITLSTAGSTFREYLDIDLAYEASGDLLVAFARTDGFDFYTMAAASTVWVNGGHVTMFSGNAAFIDVAPEPAGNRIALTVIDQDAGTERIGTATWNGSAWVNAGEIANTFPHWETDPDGPFYAGVAWVGTSGVAVVVFSDETTGEMGWARWTAAGGWVVQADQAVAGMTNHIRSFHTESFVTENEAIAIFSDKNGSLWSGLYDGATWSFSSALETSVSSTLYKPFSFSLWSSMVTAVRLTSLEARGVDGAVELSWTTGSEVDNLGFHLYRATSPEGPYVRITNALVPGLGSSPEGATYRHVDEGLSNGSPYYYELEDVETSGRRERHGPVAAVPEASAPREAAPAAIVFGEPSRTRLSVREVGSRRLVLDLFTPGLLAHPFEDGTVAIEVPGFAELDGALPVKRQWVEAISGRRVEVLSVRARDVVALGLRPADVSGEIEADEAGAVSLVRRGRGALGRTAFSGAAQLVSVGYQAERKRALLELAPLRWDERARQLLLARHLRVVLSLARPDPEDAQTTDGDARRRWRRREGSVRLVTREPGLYRTRVRDALGVRPAVASLRGLTLTRLGKPVPYHLEGGFLYFVSEGRDANPYGDEAVYELTMGERGTTMPVSRERGSGLVYRERRRFETNRLYLASLVDAPEPWLWESLLAPAARDFDFDLPGLAGTGPAELALELQGGTDFPTSEDHHVQAFVNGALVGETTWNGKNPHRLEVELGPGGLRDGPNRLEVVNVGDTAAEYSVVYVDAFTVAYPRALETVDATTLLVDVTEASPRWIRTRRGPGVDPSRTYLVASAARVPEPELRRVRPPKWGGASIRADYIAIGPRELLETARPLLDFRRRQGLAVAAVPVEEIFDELGFGEARPEAIRDFLREAYEAWEPPAPRYVLLVGDGTYDFEDALGTGVVNRVPPYLLRTANLWTASDPAYASVKGDDLLPDLAIGRLPAATPDELRAMVDKILAYELGASGLSKRVVLVTDDPDRAGRFDENARALAATVLASRNPLQISLAELGVDAARDAVRSAFDEGASLLSYLGHGGIHLWASEGLWLTSDVASLAPQPQQPIVLTMNCLNGYFHFPFFDSLAETLVQAEDKGAIAVFAPSGMSYDAPAQALHAELLEAILSGEPPTLGDAVLEAQARFVERSPHPELLAIYHLFGDPALTLKR